jgi:ElaB/YqjD/DUF883 family membrane-anchored ribosome-binding protein
MASAMETGRGKRNGDARSELRSRATDVIDDVTELRKDLGHLAEAASKAARAEVTNAGKRIQGAGGELRTRASASAEMVADRVREHPGAAIGISVGAGVLIGLLLSARR